MTTFKLVYSTIEDCNCSSHHDTLVINDYMNLEECLNSFDLYTYEVHKHTVVKSVDLRIEEDGLTKEYCLAIQEWNYDKKEWGIVETFELDLESPDEEY